MKEIIDNVEKGTNLRELEYHRGGEEVYGGVEGKF